jgi:hypothetical protein
MSRNGAAREVGNVRKVNGEGFFEAIYKTTKARPENKAYFGFSLCQI